MLKFLEMEPVEEENLKTLPEIIIPNETPFNLVENLLNMHKTAANKTALFSEMPIIIYKRNVITAPGQQKTPISLLNDDT